MTWLAKKSKRTPMKLPYFVSKVNTREKERTVRGYYGNAVKEGPESFLASLPLMAAGKVFGKEKVNKFMWKHLNEPALNVDTAVGHTLGKVPGMKGLFTQKEQIRWGDKLHRDVERPSALAPLVKARNLAVPIVAGIGIEKGVRSLKNKVSQDQAPTSQSQGVPMNQDMKKTASELDIKKMASILEPDLREKVASTMLHLHSKNKEHEKRANATRLLYKQAELGQSSIPNTFQEFEQKIASLMSQDLAVLEKAMELTAGHLKMGELSGNDSTSRDASSTFQADVLSD